MSAFLGPIHVKMYARILYQDELSGALLALAEKNGWADGLRARTDAVAPAASNEPLETLIDQNHIHGWLGNAVAQSERRFALIAGGILKKHPERLSALEDVMRDAGRQHAMPSHLDAEQAFQAIHDVLLDGMPCDFPFAVTESSSATVVWQVKGCPHASHWDDDACGAETYYQLRDAWVEGVLAGSSVSHARTGGQHTLRKER